STRQVRTSGNHDQTIRRDSGRARFPAVLGLLISGVGLSPTSFVFSQSARPLRIFFAALGGLLLMFFAVLRLLLHSFGEHETKQSYSVSSPPRFSLRLGAAVGLFIRY